MTAQKCYCGSGNLYTKCCEPIILEKKKAQTPEELMRARFSAHASQSLQFLVDSVHPDYRQGVSVDELAEWSPHVQWDTLEVHSATPGETENEGYVSFTAHFIVKDVAQIMTEDAYFQKVDGDWMYVDGKMHGEEPYERETPKVSRNEPCPCGSGKKFKKCCGNN